MKVRIAVGLGAAALDAGTFPAVVGALGSSQPSCWAPGRRVGVTGAMFPRGAGIAEGAAVALARPDDRASEPERFTILLVLMFTTPAVVERATSLNVSSAVTCWPPTLGALGAAAVDFPPLSAVVSAVRASAAWGRWIWVLTTAPTIIEAMPTERSDASVRVRGFIGANPSCAP